MINEHVMDLYRRVRLGTHGRHPLTRSDNLRERAGSAGPFVLAVSGAWSDDNHCA